MTDRELMQQALDVMLAAIKAGDWKVDGACDPDMVLEALRARLAQPEPEPVAQVRIAEDYHAHVFWMVSPLKLDQRYLYAAPLQREWIGLTDEEIREFEIWLDDEEEKHGWNPPVDIVKYIEQALKEKNT